MELHWLSILVITIMVSNSQTQSYYNSHPGSNSYQRGYQYVAPYQVPGRHRGHYGEYSPIVVPYQVPGQQRGHHVQNPPVVGPHHLSILEKSENSPLAVPKMNVDDLHPSTVEQLYKTLRQQQQEDVIKVNRVMLSLKNALTPLITLLQDVGDDNNEGLSSIQG